MEGGSRFSPSCAALPLVVVARVDGLLPTTTDGTDTCQYPLHVITGRYVA